jgi:hypothetical protein
MGSLSVFIPIAARTQGTANMTEPYLITVTNETTVLDLLAERHRHAFSRTKQGRHEWIEGTLELAQVLAEERELLPNDKEFSAWLEREGLENISHQDRAALISMVKDLALARDVLEKTERWSWRLIHTQEFAPRFTNVGKPQGRFSSKKPRGRKPKAKPVPDAMRNPPPSMAPQQSPRKFGLSPEEFDPDMEDSARERGGKYGPVLICTKKELLAHRQQEILHKWLGFVSEVAGVCKTCPAIPDHQTLNTWLKKAGKAEKYHGWTSSIADAFELVRRSLDLILKNEKLQ